MAAPISLLALSRRASQDAAFPATGWDAQADPKAHTIDKGRSFRMRAGYLRGALGASRARRDGPGSLAATGRRRL